MNSLILSRPLLGFVVGTRAALAFGVGLLVADRIPEARRRTLALSLPIGQVMTREVTTCTEEDNIATIMERMTEGKFRHMPVVSKGKLVGLISIGDVVKQRVEEIERESDALRDYIRTA